MVTKEFELPDVGEGVAEGELVTWLVEPGDTVTEDQPVAEVETDKALVEVPSRYDGTVKELLAEEGETVPVGQVIITFEVDEGDAGDEGSETGTEADADAGIDEPSGDAESAGDAASDEESEESEETATAETDDEPAGRVFAPPSTRRLARELGVGIEDVDGSGPGGRVTDADVRAHAESADSSDGDTDPGDDADEESSGPRAMSVGQGKQVVSKRSNDEAADAEESESGSAAGGPDATGGTAPSAAGRERTLAAPATRRAAAEAGVDLNDVPTDETRDGEAFVTADQVAAYADEVRAAREAETAAGAAETDARAGETADAAADGEDEDGTGGERTVPYRGVRRTIGERMAESKYTAPHVTHHDTVVVDDLVETRAALKPRAADRDVSLTYVPFVLKAVVAALEEFPILNSELREEDEEILLKDDYHVGIAVATDAGLMVPVVRNVDEKSVLDLAAEVSDLAARARSRDLSRAEMQGGTFTITNFGAIGGEYATPIINHPESAILGLGAIDERPVAEDGEVRAAHTLPLSLSVDHRVVDGADAARFTNRLMEYLADPRLLLLE